MRTAPVIVRHSRIAQRAVGRLVGVRIEKPDVQGVTSRPWQEPELTAVGRAPMHSVVHRGRLELDGPWRFQLLRGPGDEPTADWREVTVPGCWTMQGVGDRPQYTNVQMPFAGLPPEVPAENPTGLYERSFELPPGWVGRRVVLHVGAAESVLIVRLNGEEVGVSKDSHLAAEFDVTAFVRPNSNTLTLRVVKWPDASYVEDQDQWWHGGITRSVFLYATGRVHLADVKAIAGLADDLRTGTLELAVDVGFARVDPQPGWTVEARLPGLGAPLHAEAPLPAADLDAASHDVELRPRPETIVHLDAAHRGLGTASCGPDTLPGYLVGSGEYRWSWSLRRLGPGG